MRQKRDRAGGTGRMVRGAAHRGAGSKLAVLALMLAAAGCGTHSLPGDASTSSPAATATGAATSAGATPVAGTGPPAAPGALSPAAGAGPAPAVGSALAALAALPVKAPAPITGFTRDQFGPAWADVDHDGCDQRDQVLGRDLTGPTFKISRRGVRTCQVLTGTLADAYSGSTVHFISGEGTSEPVQIDHVVSLADAWQTGAQTLDAATRERLAGDPLNLQAVETTVIQSKGDGNAAAWLPPALGYRCTYVARQVAVKTIYRLWVAPSEHDSMAQILDACPTQALPRSGL